MSPSGDERLQIRNPAGAIAAVPPGRWAVGVSGGADSVALLLLLHERPTLVLHVAHLDHETREGASAGDARFVEELAARLGLPCTVGRRSEIERGATPAPTNTSARFRAARLALYRRVVHEHDLAGVILAHHADDQAETILLRLLRGSGAAGLAGMSPWTRVGGLAICRPLLHARRDELRAVLVARRQAWREDASNTSDDYRRNRVRRVLSERPALAAALLELGGACRRLRDGLRAIVPREVGPAIRAIEVLELPPPVRRELARRWLAGAGVPAGRIDPGVIERLLLMMEDFATPTRQHFPGGVLVRRKGGVLSVAPRSEPI